MVDLILVAFIGGLLTIAAPCILAVLPIILGTTLGHRNPLRPLAIVLGLTVSFTVFGVLFKYVTDLIGLSNESLRIIALTFLFIFGIALILPNAFEKILFKIQIFINKFTKKQPNLEGVEKPEKKRGLLNGFLVGASLGLIWVPCAGPILGTIITLAATQMDAAKTTTLMLAYSAGAGIPMLIIAYGGNFVVSKLKYLKERSELIQRVAGGILLVGVLLILTGYDIKIQTALFDVFPQLSGFELALLEKSGEKPMPTPRVSGLLMMKGNSAPELTGTQAWINSEPLQIANLKDKVIIIDFWTYTCINCIRTFPYLNAWHQKYKDDGLIIIGVHTPEFAFEEKLSNVQKAIKDFGIEYAVVQDNDYKTWRAYNNRFWPAKYIIDKEGYLRYTHFGEGDYEETEKVIQELLGPQVMSAEMSKVDAEAVNFRKIKTREIYLGYDREQYQANKEIVKRDKVQTYTEPDIIKNNRFYLVGDWHVEKENVTLVKAPGKIILNYEASKVNLVINTDKTIKAKVYLDGELNSSGKDVQNDGTMLIDKSSIYNLVDTGDSYERHTVTVEFLDAGAQAFAYTFG